jgi:hypothetical protein
MTLLISMYQITLYLENEEINNTEYSFTLEHVLWNSYILLQNRGQHNFPRTETLCNTDSRNINQQPQ